MTGFMNSSFGQMSLSGSNNGRKEGDWDDWVHTDWRRRPAQGQSMPKKKTISSHPSPYRGASPVMLGQATELGRFSVAADGFTLYDKEANTSFLSLPPQAPPFPWDLTADDGEGGDSRRRRRDGELDGLCDWLLHRDSNVLPNVGFITRPSAIKLLCLTPYSPNAWRIGIIRFRNKYFLRKLKTERKFKPRNEGSFFPGAGGGESSNGGGRRFERGADPKAKNRRLSHFLRIDGHGNPDPQNEDGNVTKLGVQRRLGSHRLLTVGSVDAYDRASREFSLIRLMKKLEPGNDKQATLFYRYKAAKWWAHAVLLGARTIVTGIVDGNGVVSAIRVWKPSQLAEEAKYTGAFDSQVGLNFTNAALTLIQETITDNDPNKVWVLEHVDGEREIRAPVAEPSEPSFLPDHFVAAYSY